MIRGPWSNCSSRLDLDHQRLQQLVQDSYTQVISINCNADLYITWLLTTNCCEIFVHKLSECHSNESTSCSLASCFCRKASDSSCQLGGQVFPLLYQSWTLSVSDGRAVTIRLSINERK